jgi:WD40 repeat protein
MKLFIGIATYEKNVYGLELLNKNNEYKLKAIFGPIQHMGAVNSISVSGKYLVTGSTDELIRIFNWQKKQEVGICNEHSSSISDVVAIADEDPISSSASMVTADISGLLFLWTSYKGGKLWKCVKVLDIFSFFLFMCRNYHHIPLLFHHFLYIQAPDLFLQFQIKIRQLH